MPVWLEDELRRGATSIEAKASPFRAQELFRCSILLTAETRASLLKVQAPLARPFRTAYRTGSHLARFSVTNRLNVLFLLIDLSSIQFIERNTKRPLIYKGRGARGATFVDCFYAIHSPDGQSFTHPPL